MGKMLIRPTAKMLCYNFRSASLHLPCRIDLIADELVYRLAFANERKFIPAHQRLCGQGARIVIGGHDKSIGARAHDREQVSGAQPWHFPVLRKKIAALTYWSNDVHLVCFTLTGRFAASSP